MRNVMDVMNEWLKNAACAICAKSFKDWNLYRDHMEKEHAKDLMKVGNSDEHGKLMCPRCGEAMFSKSHIQEHLAGTHGFTSEQVAKALQNGPMTPAEYRCPICSKEFYTSELGTAHMKIKHGEEVQGLDKINNSDDDDDDDELKYALAKSLSEPAKKVGTPPDKVLANADIIGIIKNQRQAGYLSGDQMKKLVTQDGFPKPVPIKLIEPGIIPYEYMNNGAGAMVLVQKPVLDKMMNDLEKSLVGKPVINEAHRDVSPEDYKNGKADGTVTRVYYNPDDGWYWCDALIWDEQTRNNLANNGYGVSCEYTALAPWGPAGTHHGIPYDKEVLDGRYKHLAVVERPRYEGARIMNSQGGHTMMKLLQWLKKDNQDVKNSVDIDPDKTSVEVDGKEVSLSNAIAAYKAQETARLEKEKAEALKNAKKLSDDDTVTIDGKEVKVVDLKNALNAQAKNASDEKMEKDHKDGDHKEKEMANCPMCNAEDKDKEEKEKKDKDAKNALLMNSQHRLGQHIQPNEKCVICDAIASERLVNAAKVREGKLSAPIVPSIDEGLRRGKQMMGKTRAQQEAEMAAK